MKHRSPAGLAAGLMAAMVLAAPAVAAPANVHVRVEGPAGTIVPRTAVTTTTTPVNKDGTAGHDCTGTSGAGALELATAGNWTGTWFAPGYLVDSIKGVAPGMNQYWGFWLNYKYSDVGVCDAELQAGDDLLFFLDCFGAGCTSPAPLRLSRVPATIAPGATTGVKVETFTTAGFPTVTTPVPAVGATVTADGRQFTTGGDGVANVTFTGGGPVNVQATKAGNTRSAVEQACVTTGSDGLCNTVQPDRAAPTATIAGIRDGQTFSRRRAPRELKGSVSEDPSGLWAVKIRLTRKLSGTCWYFSGTKERLLRRTCGKKYAFKVGDRAEWSYLLPSRLPRGRYVLDAYGVDNAINRGTPARVRFRVR